MHLEESNFFSLINTQYISMILQVNVSFLEKHVHLVMVVCGYKNQESF